MHEKEFYMSAFRSWSRISNTLRLPETNELSILPCRFELCGQKSGRGNKPELWTNERLFPQYGDVLAHEISSPSSFVPEKDEPMLRPFHVCSSLYFHSSYVSWKSLPLPEARRSSACEGGPGALHLIIWVSSSASKNSSSSSLSLPKMSLSADWNGKGEEEWSHNAMTFLNWKLSSTQPTNAFLRHLLP